MKFFHIADVHLGAEPDKGFPWSDSRRREIWDSFQRVIEQAGRENAGLLLIAGDLFHRQPLMKEIKEVNDLFASIPDTRIVLIAGNHDYLRPDCAYRRFSWTRNVFWLDKPYLSRLEFPEIGVGISGLSYDRREIREPLYDQAKAAEKLPLEILLAHGGDEKHIPFSREALALSGFDYIALGHIHRPQILLENRMAYAGALEPTDRNDTGPHGYIKGEWEEGRLRISFVPFASREYKDLKLTIREETTQFSLERLLEQKLKEQGEENIFNVLLEGVKALGTEFLFKRLEALGNIRSLEDHTRPARSFEELKKQYRGTVLESFIEGFGGQKTEMEEKALNYGIEALLVSGEEAG